MTVTSHFYYGWLYRRGSGADCKSAVFGLEWFDSITAHSNSDENEIANQTKSIGVNAIAMRSRNGMSLRWKSVLRTSLFVIQEL